MKIISEIERERLFYCIADITPVVPSSGFSLYFGYTGYSGGFNTGFGFYGRSGLVFDSNNDFFGGYYSGRPIKIETHFFEDRASYFCDGVLINNNVANDCNFNCIEFDKIGESTLNLELNLGDSFFLPDFGYVFLYVDGDLVVAPEGYPVEILEEYASP